MYSKKVVVSTVGRVLGRPFCASGKRGLSTATEGTAGSGSSTSCSSSNAGTGNQGLGGQISVRCYSMSGKRTPIDSTPAAEKQQQQQGQEQPQGPKALVNEPRIRVPKFTMGRTEFLMADFFSQYRQVVGMAATKFGSEEEHPRASFKTLSELALYQGQSIDEVNVPRAKLQQVYAAPTSVYMRVTPDAFIPEATRLGPLAEPLLGRDSFADGIGTLQLFGKEAEMREFVEEFFDSVLDNAKMESTGTWSVRRERRFRGERWMAHEMVDPFEEISGGYRMTSVRRKRKTKMNKHKHRKLRRSTRALRKRLGK
ncbi:hypothetical protein H4R99_000893 [Coemansia sp. RSA 1722]|nr:hypothetical protein IWW45_006502 [Coemansia sp. RSA 485]KAJ2605726.1 hypothetical protein H4R99_000893 [Coemansia sp. RSA 1722]